MPAKFKDPFVWFTGLIAAFLAGGAAAAASSISGIIIAPQTFNLQSGLIPTLKLAACSFIISGLLGFLQRLQKSPLPDVVTEDTVIIQKTEQAGKPPVTVTTEKTVTTTDGEKTPLPPV